MNAKNITHIIFFGVVMMLCSCARDHLYYDAKSRNLVQLNIDWSQRLSGRKMLNTTEIIL